MILDQFQLSSIDCYVVWPFSDKNMTIQSHRKKPEADKGYTAKTGLAY